MKEKASGNKIPGSTAPSDAEETPVGIPEGEELTIDPDSGELIDPVDRWWDDGEKEEQDVPRNRRLDPESRKEQSKPVPPLPVEEESVEEQSEEQAKPEGKQVEPEEKKAAAKGEDPLAFLDEEVAPKKKKAAEPIETSGPPKLPPVISDLPEEVDVLETDGDSPPIEEEFVEEKKAAAEPENSEKESEAEPEEEPPLLVLFGDEEPEKKEKESKKDLSFELPGLIEENEKSVPELESPVAVDSETADEGEPIAKVKGPPALPPLPVFEASQKPPVLSDEPKEDKPKSNESVEDIDLFEDEKESDEKVASEISGPPTLLKVAPDDEKTLDVESDADEKQKEEKQEVGPDGKAGEQPEQEMKAESEAELDSESEEEEGGEEHVTEVKEVAPRKKAGCWTIFTSLFFFASLILFIAFAVGGYVAWSKLDGIRGDLEGKARAQLAKKGIYFDYDSWKYEFPRGLVLENVKLYESEKKEKVALTASNFGLNVDFVGLARGRGSAETTSGEVTLDDAEVSLFQGGAKFATLKDVDAEIMASSGKIDVERLSTVVQGLRVELSGSVDMDAKAETAPGAEGNPKPEGSSADSPVAFDFSPFRKLAEIPPFESKGDAPVLSIEFEAKSGEAPKSLRATLYGTDFTWNKVPFQAVSALASFDPVEGVVSIPNFQIGYKDGTIGGGLSYDVKGKTLRIDRATSNADLVALLAAWNPEEANSFSQFEFLDAPVIGIKGTLPLDSTLESADLEIDYKHSQGLLCHLGSKILPLKDIRGTIRFSKGSLESNDFAADLLGGIVEVNGAIRLTADPQPFSGLIEISKLPLENLGEFFGKPDSGLSGDAYFDFRGVGYTEVEKIRGGGSLRIEEAKLPSFPAVGPVQQMLGRVLPAFGLNEQGTLRGRYLIDSGMLLTNDLTVTQGGVRLVTNGSLELASQEADFTTVASLEDSLAAATNMKDKSISVKGKGPLLQPELTLEEFPAEFTAGALQDVLGTSPKTLERLKELTKDEALIESIGDSLDEAVGEELGNEVRSILRAIPAPQE